MTRRNICSNKPRLVGLRPFHLLAAKMAAKSSIQLGSCSYTDMGSIEKLVQGRTHCSMNNPAIKRLAKELQEIQNYKGNQANNEGENADDDFIEASPLKVT